VIEPEAFLLIPLPSYLQVEVSAACNLRCVMCAAPLRRDNKPEGKAYMGPDLFRRVVDRMEGLGRLHLQGLGEPLLNPHFFRMAAYAAGKGARVTASSNMTLIDERSAELLIESGLRCLHVSVDGASSATYESIRKGASFRRLLANVELLGRAKGRASSPYPSLRMTVVLMRSNLRELAGLVGLASGLGMEEVFVQRLCHSFREPALPAHYAPMQEFFRKEDLEGVPPAVIEESFERAREAAAGLGIELRLPALLPCCGEKSRSRCDWPWTGIYVSYQGYIMPCCMVSTPDRINFGLAGEEDIGAIWSGAAYASFRERLSSADPPEICRSCSLYSGTF